MRHDHIEAISWIDLKALPNLFSFDFCEGFRMITRHECERKLAWVQIRWLQLVWLPRCSVEKTEPNSKTQPLRTLPTACVVRVARKRSLRPHCHPRSISISSRSVRSLTDYDRPLELFQVRSALKPTSALCSHQMLSRWQCLAHVQA